MLREISMEQLVEWHAYAELEPFDEVRMDYRFASVAQAVWNAIKWSKSTPDFQPKMDTLEQHRLKFGDQPGKPFRRTQTWQEQKRMAELWVKAFNSKGR